MKTALVFGGAECLFSDITRTLDLIRYIPYTTFVINDIITQTDRVDVMVTLHPEKLGPWLAKRRKDARPDISEIWAHTARHGVTHVLRDDWFGSSGLFAVRIALEKGFDHVILNGVPMNKQGGHVIRREQWAHASLFTKAWEQHANEIRPYTRSWNGYTAELLGQPTAEWLSADPPKYVRTGALSSPNLA